MNPSFETWMSDLAASPYLEMFHGFDLLVIVINVLIFLFAKPIIRISGYTVEEQHTKARVWLLRAVSLVLFVLYILAGLFQEVDKIEPLSVTGLTLLFAYLIAHLLQVQVLKRFGRDREINGEKVHTHTYQSEVIGLLVWIVASIIAFLLVINTWGLTDWLQATSVLGALLLIVYSTKDVWAPDNINGLILLYNADVDPGVVVEVRELDLLAVVLRTTLTQTVFRDLRRKHKIILPNGRFRAAMIEILGSPQNPNLDCYIDFNIGYGHDSGVVESFLLNVWADACVVDKSLNAEREPRVRLMSHGDHALVWRLFYSVCNVYKFLETEQNIRRIAYDSSLAAGLPLSTPLTHQVSLSSGVAHEAELEPKVDT